MPRLRICALALSLLLTDHLVHLVAEVALFSHLDDQLSDFVVEFVSGSGVLLGFLVPIVSNFTVLGCFLVNHFASFVEKIFEFCHASSHLFWGGFPSSRMLATHLPHLILHGRLVHCFSSHSCRPLEFVDGATKQAKVGTSVAFHGQGSL